MGDESVEPEGCVVHIIDKEKWFPFKYKYDFYYVAHKPTQNRNKEFAKRIMENETYTNLKNRLAKFRHKPTLEECIKSVASKEWLNKINNWPEEVKTDRKRFSFYCKEETKNIEGYKEELLSVAKMYYPNCECKLVRIYFLAFPNEITIDLICNNITGI